MINIIFDPQIFKSQKYFGFLGIILKYTKD